LRRSKAIRNLLLSILLTGVSLIAAFVLAEAFVRFAETDGSNFDIEMWRYARDLKRVSAIPGMGHEHVPGRSGTYMGVPVAINSVGWRDREYTRRKPPGTVRIMMLGDSLTFGWGAPPEGVTSNILEDLLGHLDGHKYEVLNTGIGNSNTAMEVAYFLNEGYTFEPDIVVLNFFINDAEPTPSRNNNFLIDNSYAAVFLAGRFDTLMRTYFGRENWQEYYRSLYEPDQPGWQVARKAIAELATFCRERGIRLVLVHYPELHQLSPYPFQDVTDMVQAQARAQDIPFLDLLPAIAAEPPASLWVTKTDAHPNGKAARKFAASLLGFFEETYPETFGQGAVSSHSAASSQPAATDAALASGGM
jgi:lysophospholipase L1-like esterase